MFRSDLLLMPQAKTQIKYIGHAMVLFQHEDHFLLTDPWFQPSINLEGLWAYPPIEKLTLPEKERINYIYISHMHPDHFCPNTLKEFNPQTKIIIGNYENKLLLVTLNRLGFRNIVELSEGAPVAVGPFKMTSYIFRPEDFSFDSALVLELNGENFFLNNDCVLPDSTYQRIFKNHDSISTGFLGYSGVSPFPTCYEFPNENTEYKNTQLDSSKKYYLDHCKRVAEFLDLKYIIPYANGLRCLKPSTLRSNITFSTPLELSGLFQKPTVLPVEPGDTFFPGAPFLKANYLQDYSPAGIEMYAKTKVFKHFKDPIDKMEIDKIVNYISTIAKAGLHRVHQSFRVNLQIYAVEDVVQTLGISYDKQTLTVNVGPIEAPDMIVKYPGELLLACAMGKASIPQIHFGFQYDVEVYNMKHDFFRMLAIRSPGGSLND